MIKPVFTLFFRVSVAAAEKVYCCSSVTTRQWNSTQCCWAAAERWGREEVSSGAFTRPWTRSCGRKLYKNCSLERNLAVLSRVYTNTQTHTPSSSLYRSLENSKACFKCLCVCVLCMLCVCMLELCAVGFAPTKLRWLDLNGVAYNQPVSRSRF